MVLGTRSKIIMRNNNIMKQIYLILTCLFFLFSTSCGDMLEDIQPYLDRGETVYVGKLDSVKVLPGKNRIKIEGKMPFGMTQIKCVINWLDPSGERDVKEFPITRTGSDDKFEFMIDNLIEGQHDFTIVTLDALGNSSIKVEASGYSYGDIYQSTLDNRNINNITAEEITVDGNKIWQATINWLNINNDEVKGCNVEYELATGNGDFGKIYVPVEELTTNITGYKPNGKLRWDTAYMPDSTSIDIFVTEKLELTLPSNQ